MWWNWIYALLLALLLGCLFLLLKHRLHAAETGESTALHIIVDANNEAPELEMLLRNLLWLQRNQILCADIIVRDLGLKSEAVALAKKMCQINHLRFIERE